MYEKLYQTIEGDTNKIIDFMLKLLSMETTYKNASDEHPAGKEVTECLNYVLDYCSKLGWKVHNHKNIYGYAEYGNGKEYVTSIGHLDIVPFGNMDDWSHSPLGEVVGDKIFGRGTVDNKGAIVASVFGLKAIVDNKMIDLEKHRIRIVFGTSEETSMFDLDEYAKVEQKPAFAFVPDAYYPCIHAEKGILHYGFSGHVNDSVIDSIEPTAGAVNIVPGRCVAVCSDIDFDKASKLAQEKYSEADYNAHIEKLSNNKIKITMNGKQGHGSTPQKCVNSITMMFKFIQELVGDKSKLTNFYMSTYADYDGGLIGIKCSDDVSGDLTNTLNVISFKNGQLDCEVDCRYPCTISNADEKIIPTITKRVSEAGCTPKYTNYPPHYVPKDSLLVKTIEDTYFELSGERKEAFAIGGGSYARKIPGAVSTGLGLGTKAGLAHQADEFIEIKGLLNDIKFSASLFHKLCYKL